MGETYCFADYRKTDQYIKFLLTKKCSLNIAELILANFRPSLIQTK